MQEKRATTQHAVFGTRLPPSNGAHHGKDLVLPLAILSIMRKVTCASEYNLPKGAGNAFTRSDDFEARRRADYAPITAWCAQIMRVAPNTGIA